MTNPGSGGANALWDEAIERMLARIDHTLSMNLDGFPNIGDPATGNWKTSPDGFWTGGFWVGMLWLADRYSGDARYRAAADKWLQRLASRVESRTVFRGLLFYPASVLGAELTGNANAREIAIRAGRSLGRQFMNSVGIIPLGNEAEEAHSVGDHDANIDGLIASPLMLWAAKSTNDHGLYKKALSHAAKSAEFFVQADGSVIQSATFDPKTGMVSRRYTHKGISETSIWTRAQAWAMLGYTLSAKNAPEEKQLTEWARTTAAWWVKTAPADMVAYWDFSAPITPEIWRDTSGTAIAASSLLGIASIVQGEESVSFRRHAEKTVQALVQRHLTPVNHADLRPPGILADGCFDVRHSEALANELIWGDYFLFESLGRLSGRLEDVTV
jgi:unsaturated chondroitin disaccharide hydrolase